MISFIGAGPGDPELLTIKGKKLIDSADVIIYAGSLVNPEVLSGRKEGAEVYNSALMVLPMGSTSEYPHSLQLANVCLHASCFVMLGLSGPSSSCH